jgi:hypothetical protein
LWGLVLISATWFVFARLGATWFALDFGYLRDLVFIRETWLVFAQLGL